MPIRTVFDAYRFIGPKSPVCTGTENIAMANVTAWPDSHRKLYHTRMVGSYYIGRKLGEGSFAKVREGLHAVTGEKVAIKVIDKEKAKRDSYLVKNLHREGYIQQMILHPNIVQLLDILETEASYYLVMELCLGGNLLEKLLEKECMGEAEVHKYIWQLAMAVEHLHSAGVVHRDLKVENLLLDENDNIKIIDFGLSTCAGRWGSSDLLSTQCGSPAYSAPELLSQRKYGPKVDIWSIGVIMYALLCGTLPFTLEPFNLRLLWQKMMERRMNPLPHKLSAGAAALLRSLLEPDPAKRPNIHQVMADPWLSLAGSQAKSIYRNRMPLEIDHHVLVHMTEKMGFQGEEVLSAVLNNRACQTLAIYYLLKWKLRRILKAHREKKLTEKVTKRHAGEEKCRREQTPVGRCSASGKQKTVLSSLLEHQNIYPSQPRPPPPIRRQETYPPSTEVSLQGRPQHQPTPASVKTHFRNLAFKVSRNKLINSTPPPSLIPPTLKTYTPCPKKATDHSVSGCPVAQKAQEDMSSTKESNRESEGPRWRAHLPSIGPRQPLKRGSLSFRHTPPSVESSHFRRRMTLSPTHTLC